MRSPCYLTVVWLAIASMASAEEASFVRGGVVVDTNQLCQLFHEGRSIEVPSMQLSDGRQLLQFDWQPLSDYTLQVGSRTIELHSPRSPAPLRVFTIPLEDVGQAAAGGTTPDSVVRFSPDSRRLAIGSFGGWLRIVDATRGEVLHKRRIAEGMVKQLAWSPDGRWLYVGEQSPDALLMAIDTSHREVRPQGSLPIAWSARLAEELETSRPPAGDRYGIYTLPAVYDLEVADDGRLLVAGLHSWTHEGVLRNASVLYCFAPGGRLIWKRPPQGAWPLNVAHIAIDRAGRRLCFLASQSQQPTEHKPLRTDTLYLLDAANGETLGEHRLEPLRPHFTRVEAWDSVSISDAGRRVALGLADGRAFLFDLDDGLRLRRQFHLGTPILVGKTPVAAACSYTRFLGGGLCMQTQNTHIPFGSTQTANQAPSPHRGANTLTMTDLDGTPQWRYRGPFSLTGNWSDRSLSGRGRWLMTTCRELPGAASAGQFGMLLFDLKRPGGGQEKLVYHYPTEGPVSFSADISPDGQFVAITEVPAPTADGMWLYGTHQVHVVH